MTKERSSCFSCGALIVLILSGALWFLNPPSAAGQDQISPLKIKVGEKAPDFALPSAGGKTIRLSDYTGRNILIDFYRGYW